MFDANMHVVCYTYGAISCKEINVSFTSHSAKKTIRQLHQLNAIILMIQIASQCQQLLTLVKQSFFIGIARFKEMVNIYAV